MHKCLRHKHSIMHDVKLSEYIPKPTGKYYVGLYQTDFIDKRRKNTYLISSKNRKLPVWIFYPALDPGKRLHYGIKEDCKKFNIQWDDNFVECFQDVEVAEGCFPCIIYSHGYNSNLFINTTFCTDMASHGYIVISISHPYEADTVYYQDGTKISFHKPFVKIIKPPNLLEKIRYSTIIFDFISSYKRLAQRQYYISRKRTQKANEHISVWSADNSFVLDQLMELNDSCDFFLYQRMDFSNGTGLAGHSFGGAAAVNSCFMDERFCCVLNLDGSVIGNCSLKNIKRPYMRIGQYISKYAALTPLGFNTAPTYDISIKDVTHIGFTDWKYLCEENHKMVGKLPKDILHELMTKLSQYFFLKYLKGDKNVLFPKIKKKYLRNIYINNQAS